MQSLTNGIDFLHATTLIKGTRSYPTQSEDLDLDATARWWGYFRHGERLRLTVDAGGSPIEARILDTNLQLLGATVVTHSSTEIEVTVAHDGIAHFRFDGEPGQHIKFSVDVIEPRKRATRRSPARRRGARLLAGLVGH